MTEQEQKQSKEIAKMICKHCDYYEYHSNSNGACTVNKTGECPLAKESAQNILSAGYGDTKQAVREFAEKLKERIRNYNRTGLDLFYGLDEGVIADLVKETCGE